MTDHRVYFTVVDAPDRTVQSALGRRILGRMAADLLGVDEALFCIAAEPSGRLVVNLMKGDPADVFVSLSHSGPILACAATLVGPVGIDIEQPRAGRNIMGIAEAAFGPSEQERCIEEGERGFYRIWTIREAIAKAQGHGLAMVGDRCDRAAAGPDEGCWRWQDWHLAHMRLPQAASLAVAVLPQDASTTGLDWRAFTDANSSAGPHWTFPLAAL